MSMLQTYIRRYAKAAVAGLAAGAVALQAAITDQTVTPTEWLTIAVAVAGALGVLGVRNSGSQEG